MLMPIVTVMQSVVRDVVRPEKRGDNLLRAGSRIVRVLDLWQQHHEFIPALAADRVRVPDARQQASRHRLQQRVGHHMSQPVVHALEPIQAEEQDGKAVAVAAGQAHRLG